MKNQWIAKKPSSPKNTYVVFTTVMQRLRDIFTTMPHDNFNAVFIAPQSATQPNPTEFLSRTPPARMSVSASLNLL
jgi:hypothetical protein